MIARLEPAMNRPREHLLVFDIGNTTTTLGVWSHGDVRTSTTVLAAEFDSLAEIISEHWQAIGGDGDLAACSVVPARLTALASMVERVTRRKLGVVGSGLPIPLPVRISEPRSVGMDRLCSAAAAYAIEHRACAIVDLGTAITVDCVDDDGTFMGGAILPGLNLQARVLAEHTALLPRITMKRPEGPLGQNTEHAIRSGIFFGCIGAIKALVENYASIAGRWPVLFLTGGDAALIAEDLQIADKVVPHLCLRGVALSYEQFFLPCPTAP